MNIELTAFDGHKLSAYKAQPGHHPPRGAVIVVQEIFGVNSHIRAIADSFAADGYLAIAPAFFDRLQRGYETGYQPADIEAGRAMVAKLDWQQTFKDLGCAIEHARAAGKVAVLGYCWGGTVAWRAASACRGLSAAVCYYGGMIGDYLDEAPRIKTLLHFGELDKHPSVETARALAARYPQLPAHIYPGVGHGFNCDQRASYDAQAAALARERTLEFLDEQLGVRRVAPRTSTRSPMVAAAAGVGTEKVFENDQVIVWNFVLQPGQDTPMHTHEKSYMWYAIEGAPLQIFDEQGNDLGTLDVPTGAVYSLKLEGGMLEVLSDPGKGMRVPARHRARNVGPTPYREVLVEYK